MKLSKFAALAGVAVVIACFTVMAGTGSGPGYLLLDISTWKPGKYPVVITIDANGNASAVPLAVTKLGAGPSDPGTPIPSPSSLRATVAALTKAVTDPVKAQNAAGLSVIYSLGSSLAAGGKTPAETGTQVKKLTDEFLSERKAGTAWAAWRKGVGQALAVELAAGRLTTSDQYSAALSEIAAGLDGEAKSLTSMSRKSGKRGGRFGGLLKTLLKVLGPILAEGGEFNWATVIRLIIGALG